MENGQEGSESCNLHVAGSNGVAAVDDQRSHCQCEVLQVQPSTNLTTKELSDCQPHVSKTNISNDCSTVINCKDKALSENAINYQEIVDKLHKLAVEPNSNTNTNTPLTTTISTSSSSNTDLAKENGVGDHKVTASTNGYIRTPPITPTESVNELPQRDTKTDPKVSTDEYGIDYVRYQSELQMSDIMSLISRDLSEPYSIYTYRYFIHNWPNLCFLAMDGEKTVGAIVCKIDPHKRTFRSRGYIGMLAVDHMYRRKKIGSKLVRIAIEAMIVHHADEIVLETEVTNVAALNLYERLGFVRDKRLHRYYLNGVDAIRLKLWIT